MLFQLSDNGTCLALLTLSFGISLAILLPTQAKKKCFINILPKKLPFHSGKSSKKYGITRLSACVTLDPRQATCMMSRLWVLTHFRITVKTCDFNVRNYIFLSNTKQLTQHSLLQIGITGFVPVKCQDRQDLV